MPDAVVEVIYSAPPERREKIARKMAKQLCDPKRTPLLTIVLDLVRSNEEDNE